MLQAGRIESAEAVKEFVTAGNARFTLVSVKTGTRFTYKVRKAQAAPVSFVSVLTQADNENGYTYMGILKDNKFSHTAKSRVTAAAPSAKAFDWVWRQVEERKALPAQVEVWHEGRCGRCGRALTVPESIARGIGPECFSKMGG